MQNELGRFIGKITGWDKNPTSVFYYVIPLAVLGFGLMLTVAIMHYRYDHNIVFLYIWMFMVVLLVVALIPAFRMMRFNRKLRKQ
jgi:hypothetical protein